MTAATHAALTGRTAAGATLGLIDEPALLIELLLLGSEREGRAALDARQGFVGKCHKGKSQMPG